MVGERIETVRVGSQRSRAASDQFRVRDRIPAREQSHLVSEPDEFLGQIRDDAFRAPVLFRRHAFIERRDLRYLHE